MTVLTLFLTATILLASRLWLDMGRASIVSVQTQTAADVATLSSLRMRTESLRAIATRWQEYGDSYGAARLDGTVDLPAARWAEVEAKAGELKRALPSYQGRSTAILKVVADANGFSREDLEILDNAGSRHGVAAESLIVRDEKGQQKIISGGWLRRLWRSDDPEEVVWIRLPAFVQVPAADSWEINRQSFGRVVRNGDESGYPFSWAEAVHEGRLVSLRNVSYRARLKKKGAI